MTEAIENSPAAKTKSPAFKVIHGVVKTLAIVIGLPLTILSLMSLIGLVTDNIWIRLVPAVIVALGAPLFLVDRLLPDDDQAASRGMPTDVLSIVWLGFGVLFIGLGQPITGGLLTAEADRYATSGVGMVAQVTYWMAGATPVAPSSTSSPGSSDDADAGAGDAGDAGASATGDAAPNAVGGGDAGASSEGDSGPTKVAEVDAGPSKAPTKGDEKAKTYTPAELFRKVSPAVVTISVRGKRPYDEGSGTGFFIDDQGTIATNQHVIKNAKSVGVKLIGQEYSGGHRWIHEVELLSADAEVDLALLRVPPIEEIEPLELGDSEDATVGERIICIGNPLGLEHTLSDGLISARRVHRNRRWVQMTAPISPGNSGGPVISMSGHVVGIATATVNRMFGSAQNLNLAVPVNALKAMIRDDYPERRQFEAGPGGSSTW